VSGFLFGGAVVEAPGLNVIGPHDAAWSHLSPGDFTRRTTRWIRQYILHKTIADDPEVVLDGAGPTGADERTAKGWIDEFTAPDRRYAGAHVLGGHDGRISCLCDLLLVETFHATASNPWSIGHEMCELPGGRVYRTGLEQSITACLFICELAGIQWQMQKRGTYSGHPIARMDEHGATPGGPDMVGIFGHRLNTERRGKWDPGEVAWDELAERGVMEFDFAKGEDKDFWKPIQEDLAARGLYHGAIDGIPGPGVTAALKLDGYRSGIYALGRAA
jgi:hypothetical protein